MEEETKRRDQIILEEIRKNPFVSQQSLADHLGLSRSAVAGWIAGLIKEGKILGRAYVLADATQFLCIGGANVDRKAQLKSPLTLATSNPIASRLTLGGVARNVAENLVRVGMSTALFTLLGEDEEGKRLLRQCQEQGIEVSMSPFIPGAQTGSYTAVLGEEGEMVVALADMDIYEAFTPSLLETQRSRLRAYPWVIVDTNLPTDSLQWLMEQVGREQGCLCLLPVSVAKAMRLPSDLSGVNLLIGNREEIGAVLGTEILSAADAFSACARLVERGVDHVVVTLGREGVVFYGREGVSGHVAAPDAAVVDVTGAGDAFAAGVLVGLAREKGLEAACQLGSTFAKVTLESEASVAAVLSADWLNQQEALE